MRPPVQRAALLVAVLALAGCAAAWAEQPAAPADTTGSAPADTTGAAAALGYAAEAEPPPLTPQLLEQLLTALADSLAAEGISALEIESEVTATRERLLPDVVDEVPVSIESEGLFFNCTNNPSAGVQANVMRVGYNGRLANSVQVAGDGRITDTYNWGYETYRRQDKTVETRGVQAGYESGNLLPVRLNMQVGRDWSKDVTTNTAGSTNVNQRELWRGGVSANKGPVATGPIVHRLTADWFLYDQQAVNLGQHNDFQETEVSAALRSGMRVAEGVQLATRMYVSKRDGESTLAGLQSPSSTTGDSLGAGVYYGRQRIQGQFTVTQSSFDRRFLDFYRNSNGLIDTLNVPEGASKVVQELEEKDALSLAWDNSVRSGRYQMTAKLEHTFNEQQYAVSGVGRRERLRDAMALRLMAPVGRDSFVLDYKYEWSWDAQQLLGAQASLGRQYRKVRNFSVDWIRSVFRNTTLSGRYRTELAQDIAQNAFNENDRDRLVEEARLKVDARWPQRFTVSLLGEYQRIDDVAIRRSRSANNNARRTYEIAPSYRFFISPNVILSQTFRMYIQYQDFTFAHLENVNKDDSFNKRGNLATTVTVKPSERLEVVVKHDFNQRYNGTRTGRDAAGRTFYRRDQAQTINRIELGLSWNAITWARGETLRLQSATYRTLDTVERFGTTNTLNERYSGELWLGATLNRKWGSTANPLSVDGRIKRVLAYGPNVTNTSRDYWEADVQLKWTF
ncbi:MAG: hypothetical protein RBT60_12815 [Candidatus Krumholzibacteria bacterium]|jgi:hypothetical protein|nr:hypothetical protein [Candidatus Krumholzibacteria bacterium]